MSPNLTCFSFNTNMQAQSVEELELKSQHLGEEITQLTAERDGLELSLAERGDKINCLESDLDKCIEKFEYLLLSLSPYLLYLSSPLSLYLLYLLYLSTTIIYICNNTYKHNMYIVQSTFHLPQIISPSPSTFPRRYIPRDLYHLS